VRARVHVSGHGDVDDEECAPASSLHRALDHVLRDHVAAARGAHHHHVAQHELLLEVRERRGRAAKALRELGGALEVPVADPDRAGALAEALRGGLGHLPGAHEQHRVPREVAEDAPREVHGHAADAHRAGPERGLGAHALRDGERARHAAPEQVAERPRLDGEVVRLLHLAEDLRLAEDHALEARRDPEDVADGLLAVALVEVARELLVARERRVIAQHLAHRVEGGLRHRLTRAREDLDAVARGEEEGLGDLAARAEPREQHGQRLARGGEALAHLDGRGAVGEAHDHDARAAVSHGVPARAVSWAVFVAMSVAPSSSTCGAAGARNV
jgi:hypothetical protein